MLRRLRIAASVFFAILALATICLWVRSYWRCDFVSRVDASGHLTTVGSNAGAVYLDLIDNSLGGTGGMIGHPHGWKLSSPPMNTRAGGSFEWMVTPFKKVFRLPDWIFVGLFAASAFVPWIKKRFSLRTMLIASTLIAVLLGAVVASSR